MKTISALQEKVFATGLSHPCCMGNVGGTVHLQLLAGEVLSSLYVYMKTWCVLDLASLAWEEARLPVKIPYKPIIFTSQKEISSYYCVTGQGSWSE